MNSMKQTYSEANPNVESLVKEHMELVRKIASVGFEINYISSFVFVLFPLRIFLVFPRVCVGFPSYFLCAPFMKWGGRRKEI